MSGLNWVQTVCKGYQQTTEVATNWERVKVPSTTAADNILNFFLKKKKFNKSGLFM